MTWRSDFLTITGRKAGQERDKIKKERQRGYEKLS
jgi:hypothetical protein